jgi:hypothetical protein
MEVIYKEAFPRYDRSDDQTLNILLARRGL